MREHNAQAALDQAVRYHAAGDLENAEQMYREILDKEPRNPGALHLLGVLAHQVGENEAARELIESAVAVKPDYAEAHCDLGLVLKATGDLQDAVTSIRRAVAINPDYAQAHNNLGNVYQALGSLEDAVASYESALSLRPDYVNALSNLGVVLKLMGRLDDAIEVCSRAVELEPGHADAHGNLGLAFQARGDFEEAVNCFKRTLEIDPEDAATHNNLGNLYQEMERLDDAVAHYQQAIALAPDFVDSLNNLGNVFHELERYDDAIDSYKAALALDEDNVDAYNNLGLICQDQCRFEDAVAHYRKALAIDEDYANAHSNIGQSLTALGRSAEALTHFDTYIRLTRGPDTLDSREYCFRSITRAKIDHDIEQFRYLEARGREPERFGALAALYEVVRDEIDWPAENGKPVLLDDDQYARIGESYNRPIHVIDAPRIDGSALSKTLDADAITRRYFDNAPGMTFIDGILEQGALIALRRFLLESTIWFDFRYHRGYLGAFLNKGLACPLVLQIAEDFRATFPEIFKDYRLVQCWAYKYDSRLQGIDVHADVAAVNVNFWVTPDPANLDPEHGGLVVYKVEAPMDWRFAAYNTDQKRIRRFLSDNDRGRMVVPHAQNRAVLFNSDLFHETDGVAFAPGYENRRINVTMLFGRRQDDR